MKKIEAIIRRTRFEDVKEALLAADIEWFSHITDKKAKKIEAIQCGLASIYA